MRWRWLIGGLRQRVSYRGPNRTHCDRLLIICPEMISNRGRSAFCASPQRAYFTIHVRARLYNFVKQTS